MRARASSVVALAVILTAFAAAFAPLASGAVFSTNVRVNTATVGNQIDAAVAIGTDGTVYVVWEDYSLWGPRNPVIFYAKSTDGGLTWTTGVPVDPGPIPPIAVQKYPSIALSSGQTVHVVWLDLTYLGTPIGGGVVYTRSIGGSPFSTPTRISGTFLPGSEFVKPRIATYDATPCQVHAVWSVDGPTTPPPVPFTYVFSPDCGNVWATEVVMDPAGYDASVSAASDGAVGVAYVTGPSPWANIKFNVRRLGGNWGTAILVNDVLSPYNTDPSIALQFVPPATDLAHIAWADWRYGTQTYWWDWDIFYSKATNPGPPYADVRVLDTSVPDLTEQTDPSVGVDGFGNPRVSWTDWRNDPLGHRYPPAGIHNADVMYAESLDGGATFSPNQRVNDDATDREQSFSDLAEFGNDMGIAWQDERDAAGDFNVYYAATGPPILEWCGIPGFMTDGVDPDSGDTSTLFTFCVKYRSPTNTPPAADNPKLLLTDCWNPMSGSPFPMGFHSWVGVSGDYRTGARYVYSTTLDCGLTYNYGFQATDALGRAAVVSPAGSGPEVYGWSDMTPGSSPLPRKSGAMAFDAESRVTVLFGGIDASGGSLHDTWAYDHRTKAWTNMNPSPSPPFTDANSLAAAYDSDVDRVLVWGVWRWGTAIYVDTWAYDYNANQWSRRVPFPEPNMRTGPSMAFDPVHHRTIMFGGYNAFALDETWEYDYAANAWTWLSPVASPPPRSDAAMAFDAGAGDVILFGGYDPDTGIALSDTWEYDYGANTWTQRFPASSPSARYGHGMAFDADAGATVLFGGSGDLGDTWRYDYTPNTWTPVTTPASPPGRSEHMMAYDSWCKVIVLFGGERAGAALGDTWTIVVP